MFGLEKHQMDAARHDQIPEIALEWHHSGGAALATVMRTWGSAPRPPGSQLAISSDGRISGSVSGGCVEGAVVAEALDIFPDGQPGVLEFGVSDEDAFAVGLACGGKIEVLVEPVGGEFGLPVFMLDELVQARRRRKAVALLVNVSTWEHRLQFAEDTAADQLLADRFRSDRSGQEGDWFVGIHNPPLRMIVVGGVHIAQPLLSMANLVGYDTVLIDPRDAFASRERFPDQRIVYDWPDESVAAEKPDFRTAIVTLTHDPKIDDPAIKAALDTDAFYIGCLGSTRTHAKRVNRLEGDGISCTGIGRIHAPIGLDVGAKSPSEIAVAILAEITQCLRKGASAP